MELGKYSKPPITHLSISVLFPFKAHNFDSAQKNVIPR